jgi:transcriptional regulator with XRE-family HTH domain
MKADQPITDAARHAIEQSGLTRYELSKLSGVSQAQLSLFMSGKRGLTTTTLDRLSPILGLALIVKPMKRKGSK